jgi:hypothetical protein
MEFLKEHWHEIKEYVGIYSITTYWNFDLPQEELSNFISIELDNTYTDMKSIFKKGLKRDKWIKLLGLNYHNRRYRLVHKRYIDSLLRDINKNNGVENNFCPIFIFMNYIYTNIEDFRHKEQFMLQYTNKVHTLIDFFGIENEGGKFDILIDLLNDIRLVL